MHEKNQRKHPRRPLHYPAKVDFGDGKEARHCRLWDISEGGAKITIGDDEPVPDQVELVLSYQGINHRKCRVVWRNAVHLGVEFIKPI